MFPILYGVIIVATESYLFYIFESSYEDNFL